MNIAFQSDILMENAHSWAKLSKCQRAKVGAVIAKNGRVISTGYNGTPSGLDNCCEETPEKSKNTVIHAEMNCILFAAKEGHATNGCHLFVTLSPCVECSKAIIQAGITKVFYSEKYRDESGINLLREAGVTVVRLE